MKKKQEEIICMYMCQDCNGKDTSCPNFTYHN